MQSPELLLPGFARAAPGVSRAQVRWRTRDFTGHNGGKRTAARSLFGGSAIGIDCKVDGQAAASEGLQQANGFVMLDASSGARQMQFSAEEYQAIKEARNGAPQSWVGGVKHYCPRNEQ